jgi:hypothetical protein
MIHDPKRKVLIVGGSLGEKDRLDPRHLPIVGGGGNAQEHGLCEPGDGGKTDHGGDECEDLLTIERLQTYKNHSSYGFYSNGHATVPSSRFARHRR